MDVQKPSPRGRSSSTNPDHEVVAECKTPWVVWERYWCSELTDILRGNILKFPILSIANSASVTVCAS